MVTPVSISARQREPVHDPVLPMSLFHVMKKETFVKNGVTMQRWTLVTEASDIDAWMSSNGYKSQARRNWNSMVFTVHGERADINFSYRETDWNGDEVAGWRFYPQTQEDVQVLDRAEVDVLIIND